uniref:Acyl-CoA thioesterase 4 n=1 Tax=Oryctolagus cuniculus TaxID=9986 RepID=G1U6I6_RABIT
MDIFGVGGGLLEYRASLLAGKGFAVMALAYYNYDDLPKSMDTLHLEYFEEAVNYLISRPEVKGPGIGLLGHSKGGELCLTMTSFLKGITAAVIINGSIANVGGTLRYKDMTLPPIGANRSRIKMTKEGFADIVDALNSPLEGPDQKSLIPVERSECTFLFLVGQDDHNWKSPGPFPGIVDMFGVGGGLLEYRASLLAGKGFAVMALAYYNYDDLPKSMDTLHLEYFEEAVNYLISRPEVKGPGIGLLGHSKGGELGLTMTSFLKGITAAVIINGSIVNVGGTLHYKDVTLPPIGANRSRIKMTKEGFADIVDALNSPLEGPDQKSLIPVERSECTFLFLVGQDDHNWKSEFYANEASKRLQAQGKAKPQIICYPEAGHYIEPPYFPLCRASLHALVGGPVFWGGEPRAHAVAQVDAWKQLQTFFHKHLGGES